MANAYAQKKRGAGMKLLCKLGWCELPPKHHGPCKWDEDVLLSHAAIVASVLNRIWVFVERKVKG